MVKEYMVHSNVRLKGIINMWIRSQDRKTLINTNEIWIWNDSPDSIIKCNTQSISTTGGWTIGSYKTEERCIKILDEIQILLRDYLTANEYPNIIFEMPIL